MPYTHTSLTQFKTQLTSRLEGTYGSSHWINDELNRYTWEALRTWGLMTGFWRDRGIFTTTPGTAFYDINQTAGVAGAPLTPLLGYSVTDRDTLILMQYMLCEPSSLPGTTPDGTAGAGMGGQYAFADLVAALQRARNQLISDSLVTVGQRSIAVPAGNGVVPLPDTVISIRRAVWRSVDGVVSNVHWSDETEATSYNQLYPLSPGIPELYSIMSAPPLTVHLIPPPVDGGTLELITAEAAADLSPGTTASLLYVPDDTVWVARELAMADVLGRDGSGHDPTRSAASRRRYEMGVQLITDMAQIVFIEFGSPASGLSTPVIPCGLAELDYGYPSPHWQTAGNGAPRDLGTIAGNMIALRPVPDGPSYSIALDVVRKAIIPQPVGVAYPAPDGSDYIQIPREDIAALLDGAQSYALYKLGGQDLSEGDRLFKSMMTAAARYNARLSTLGYGARSNEQSRWNDQSFPEMGQGAGLGALDPKAMAQQGGGNQ